MAASDIAKDEASASQTIGLVARVHRQGSLSVGAGRANVRRRTMDDAGAGVALSPGAPRKTPVRQGNAAAGMTSTELRRCLETVMADAVGSR